MNLIFVEKLVPILIGIASGEKKQISKKIWVLHNSSFFNNPFLNNIDSIYNLHEESISRKKKLKHFFSHTFDE